MRREPHYEKQSGGSEVHIKDCYLWAEIQYLDSPTDYRECIRPDYVRDMISGGFTIEDERTSSHFEALGALTFIGFLACLFLVLITRW